MATNYPATLDNSTSLPYPSATDDTNNPSLSGGQDNQNDALIAIETLVGSNSSQTTPTAQYNVLQATSTSASEWGLLTSSNVTSATGSGDFVFATSPTISNATLNTPTINNPTLNTDSVIGYTTSNNGTVFGVGITGGVIDSAALINTVNNAAIQSNSLYTSKIYNPYKFNVYWAAGQASYLTTTQAIIKFDTALFDTGNNYNTSTYEFTAPVSGFYVISTEIMVNNGSTAGYIQTSIYKNGTSGTLLAQTICEASASSSNTSGISNIVVQLTATDTISVYGTTSATWGVNGGQSQTWLSGYLLSAS